MTRKDYSYNRFQGTRYCNIVEEELIITTDFINNSLLIKIKSKLEETTRFNNHFNYTDTLDRFNEWEPKWA